MVVQGPKMTSDFLSAESYIEVGYAVYICCCFPIVVPCVRDSGFLAHQDARLVDLED